MIAHSHNVTNTPAALGSNKQKAQFNPYVNNEGTVLGKLKTKIDIIQQI
jgi:hypothetical protein